VGTPIEVLPGVDAEKLGQHYVAVNELQTNPAYQQMGEKVVTRYETTTLHNGTKQVVIIEDHL